MANKITSWARKERKEAKKTQRQAGKRETREQAGLPHPAIRSIRWEKE